MTILKQCNDISNQVAILVIVLVVLVILVVIYGNFPLYF